MNIFTQFLRSFLNMFREPTTAQILSALLSDLRNIKEALDEFAEEKKRFDTVFKLGKRIESKDFPLTTRNYQNEIERFINLTLQRIAFLRNLSVENTDDVNECLRLIEEMAASAKTVGLDLSSLEGATAELALAA